MNGNLKHAASETSGLGESQCPDEAQKVGASGECSDGLPKFTGFRKGVFRFKTWEAFNEWKLREMSSNVRGEKLKE